MNFRDPKTGKVFESILAAVDEFCEENGDFECKNCPLRIFEHNCCDKAREYPIEAARLMGYEVIEDTPTALDDKPTVSGNRPTEEEEMDKQDKPLSEWKLDEAKQYCIDFREHLDVGVCEDADGCVLRKKGICKAAKTWPHLWDLSRLTEPEIAIMRDCSAKWVSKDSGSPWVKLWNGKPEYRMQRYAAPEDSNAFIVGRIDENLFPSVHPGDCIKLEDTI